MKPSDGSTQKFTLEIKGIGPCPSFKNAKRIIQPEGQPPRLVTKKEVKQWMKAAVSAIAYQLRSESQTRGYGTTPECLKQFVTAFCPLDDGWQDLEIGSVRTELCAKGEEGATITIERIK